MQSDHDRLVAIHAMLDPSGQSEKSIEELLSERLSERYTLEEAKSALALRKCRDFGHDLDVVQSSVGKSGYIPLTVTCDRCDKAWKVVPYES